MDSINKNEAHHSTFRKWFLLVFLKEVRMAALPQQMTSSSKVVVTPERDSMTEIRFASVTACQSTPWRRPGPE